LILSSSKAFNDSNYLILFFSVSTFLLIVTSLYI
jgi:hypothetical protein